MANGYNYHYDIATSKAKGIFKLLFRWSGSVWKAVVYDLLVWYILYAFIAIIYRLALSESQQRTFERFALFCDNRMSYIPLSFMLSFFVSTVVSRWMTQFANLGMIDNIALFTSSYIKGTDDRCRQIRRNIVRYCVLSQALVFRDIHLGVRKRFPSLQHLVAAGFLQPHELKKFESVNSRYAKYWVPFNWALHLVNMAKQENLIEGDIPRNAIAQEIRNFRSGLSLIWTYDWVPLPIMYPQLIFLAVHTYFFICLFSRQIIITPGVENQTELDVYIPFMTTLEFIFFMGWAKVAMALLNPFGEDSDDFDCNFLLDRNLSISLTAVDNVFDDVPNIEPDQFWDDAVVPLYSRETATGHRNFYMGSANREELEDPTEEVVEMVAPTETHDHYVPRRRRRTGTSVFRSNPRSRADSQVPQRNSSISSVFTNVFRKKADSIDPFETVEAADGPGHYLTTRTQRASTDVGQTFNGVMPAFINPTFVVETADGRTMSEDDILRIERKERDQQQTSPRTGGNVKDHLKRTRSFDHHESTSACKKK